MTAAARSAQLAPGALLAGKIRLVKKVGRGGMGDVWRARNESTDAEVAVKTLHPEARTQENDDRFRREARIAATIAHRNVVRVFDLVDEPGGTLGLVMELLRGDTLEVMLLERGTLTVAESLALALPILSALDHVHQKGIIHRDIKPGNVFLSVEPDGHVIPKLVDFGIAKVPKATSNITVDGTILGTPHYMSPEMIRQRSPDRRSDLFAVAVMLYEMLTGVQVFKRDVASASLVAVLEEEVDPDPRIPPRVWLALSRALSKSPYERQATCAELAKELRAAVEITDAELAAAQDGLRPPEREPDPMTSGASSAMLSASMDTPAPAPRPRGVRYAIFGAVAGLSLGILALASLRGAPPAARATIPPATSTAASAEAASPPPRAEPPPPPIASTTANEAPSAEPPPAPPSPPAQPNKRSPPPKRPKPAGVATTPGF